MRISLLTCLRQNGEIAFHHAHAERLQIVYCGRAQLPAPFSARDAAKCNRLPPRCRERGLGAIFCFQKAREFLAGRARFRAIEHSHPRSLATKSPGRLVHQKISDQSGIVRRLPKRGSVLGGICLETAMETSGKSR